MDKKLLTTRCVVPHCDSGKGTKRHMFPKNSALGSLWVEAVQHPVLSTLSYPEIRARAYWICFKHFSAESIHYAGRKPLSQEAVPTLFLPPKNDNNIIKAKDSNINTEDIKLKVEVPHDSFPSLHSSGSPNPCDIKRCSSPVKKFKCSTLEPHYIKATTTETYECESTMKDYMSDNKMSIDKIDLDALAIENFREYLRIPSVHPDINYDDCVAFIRKQAESLSLPMKVYEIIPKKPVVILTWKGTKPEKPSILLNGHMDVVPVFPDEWTHPPFSAHMNENGDIYARGSQDMKNVSIQYLEAIRRLKINGIKLKRTVHISFVPDEEIGGTHGMKSFVKSEQFKALNVGFALDEGTAYPIEPILVYYGERSKWDVWIHCSGQPGHGSMMTENNSGEKLYKIIDRFMKFREAEKAKLLLNPQLKPGDVTSINLTMLQGGVQINVIPKELSVGFDVRIAPDVNHQEFENMIKKWCEESGSGVSYTIIGKDLTVENTKLDNSNPFWQPFKEACDNFGVKLEPVICPGGTDARFVRSVGIPALGFTPSNNTPVLLHDNNERLNKDVFLRGIEIYMKVIPAVANVC